MSRILCLIYLSITVILFTSCSVEDINKSPINATDKQIENEVPTETNVLPNIEVIVGGTVINDGAVIGDVSWEKGSNYEQLIFGVNEIEYDVSGYSIGESYDTPCSYSIYDEYYPRRIVAEFSAGVNIDAIDEINNSLESLLIKEIYTLPVFETGTSKYCIVLNKNVAINIVEEKNPAEVIIKLELESDQSYYQNVYSICSIPFSSKEDLMLFQEKIYEELNLKSRILKMDNGDYYLDLGYFEDELAAHEKMMTFVNKTNEYSSTLRIVSTSFIDSAKEN